MNKREENKLTMYEGLLTLLQANSAKVQSVGGFADAIAELTAIVGGIKAKETELGGATAGKAAAKYNAEDALVAALLPVSSALYMYGRKQNDTELQERAKTTEARLRTLRDTELASFGTTIGELATAHSGGIAPYGVTPEAIADLKTKAGTYSSAIGARESSIADRKGARESLSDLFARADDMLNEEFDHFMELLRPTETELYNKYFAARVVKDTGVRHKTNGETVPAEKPQG